MIDEQEKQIGEKDKILESLQQQMKDIMMSKDNEMMQLKNKMAQQNSGGFETQQIKKMVEEIEQRQLSNAQEILKMRKQNDIEITDRDEEIQYLREILIDNQIEDFTSIFNIDNGQDQATDRDVQIEDQEFSKKPLLGLYSDLEVNADTPISDLSTCIS